MFSNGNVFHYVETVLRRPGGRLAKRLSLGHWARHRSNVEERRSISKQQVIHPHSRTARAAGTGMRARANALQESLAESLGRRRKDMAVAGVELAVLAAPSHSKLGQSILDGAPFH